MHKQVTSQLLMVRPANFSSNIETLETNKFQTGLNVNDSQESIQSLAIEEFDNMEDYYYWNGFIYYNLGNYDVIC